MCLHVISLQSGRVGFGQSPRLSSVIILMVCVCVCGYYSFPQCFAAEFAPLRPVLEGGVPLEHLISCVSGVQVSASKGSFRKVQWAENRRSDTGDLTTLCLITLQ